MTEREWSSMAFRALGKKSSLELCPENNNTAVMFVFFRKDTIAVKALRENDVIDPLVSHTFMPYHIPATSLDGFKDRLRELGVNHLHADPDGDSEAILLHVCDWLKDENNRGWMLYIEDLNIDEADFSKYIPPRL